MAIACVAALILVVLSGFFTYAAMKGALLKQYEHEMRIAEAEAKEQQESQVCTAADIYAKGMETSYENYSKYIHNELQPCLEYLKATGELDRSGAYLWEGKDPDWYVGDVNEEGQAHGYGKIFVPDSGFSGVGTFLFG